MIRKVIMVLALAALMSAVAVGQSADESGASSSGTCGDNLVWTLDDDGTLEISGFGNMSDYIFAGSSPWGKDVKAVVLGGEVNSIGKHAFYGCASLQSMEIPASVTSIGIGAFEGCTSLAFVYIPDSVTSIGSSAFSGCTSLNRFSGSYSGIIDGVMIVSGNVLISCAAGPEVVSVTIPSNVTSTGSSAFSGCTSLASISVDSENESFVLKDGILYSKDESKLIFVPGGISGSISVPSSVTSIDSGAFSSCISLADIAVDEGSNSYASYDGALYNKSYSTIIAIPYLKETLSFPDSTASLSFSYGITYSPNLLSIEVPSNMLLGAGLGNSSTLSNFKSLKEVEFKEGRTSIPAYALAFCSSLETVVIPSTVTEIGARAFTDCSSLQQIVIPESVTTIGGWAFAGTPMTTISLPGSVNRIVSNTGGNYNSTSVYYSAFTSSNLCEISVDSSNEHFTSIDGVLFSKDGTELVCYPSGRDTKEYSVPSSVIKIGEAAFRGAEKIEKVILNNAVTLGADSFRDCSSLDDLDTCGVKQIGSNALSGCSSLKRLDLRAAESVYDDYDYNNGIGLLLYDVDGEQHLGGGLEGYLYVDGGSGKLCRMNTCGEDVYYIIDSEGTILILGSGVMYDYVEGSSPWYDERNTISGVVVEDGVESIGAYAFYGCSSLSSVSIPEGVASIEQYAFYGCSSLLSVTIPEGVAYIGAFAFYGCSSLESVEIPSSVAFIWGYAFYGCSSLESVDIPEFVVSIDDGAFSGCTSLNSFGGSYPGIVNGVMLVSGGVLVSCAAGPDVMSVSIPESVRSVGSSAFRGCSSLFSVEIPSSVTSIGSSAFKGCTSLSSVEIPEGVASIGDAVFQGCTSLSSVDIPGSVTTIGSFAFSGCSSLSSVDIPEGVASISFCVFRGCSSLASVSIPGSVTSIDGYAFDGCSSLASVSIPGSMTSIEISAFRGCSSLSSVAIPEGVESIGISVFEGCISLTSVSIPEGVESIGINAFRGCSSLASVSIPGSVATIGSSAFSGCPLKSVTLGSPVVRSSWFSGIETLDTVALLDTVVRVGEYAFSGCTSLSSVDIPGSVDSIGDSAFSGCTSLSSVSIPEGVTSIGSNVFYGCTSLSSVSIPEGVTSIGGYAFSGCNSLSSVSIPEGVESIGNNAFYGCTSLSSVAIQEGVVSIADYTFYGCSSLAYVEMPSSVTSIGDFAFNGCTSLAYVETPSSVTIIGSSAFSVTFKDSGGSALPKTAEALAGKTFWGLGDGVLTELVVGGAISVGEFDYEVLSVDGLTLSVKKYNGDSESVVVPNTVDVFTVKSIGDSAFFGCSSLAYVDIPSTVTTIGLSAFSSCSSLASVVLGGGDLNIGQRAFSGCTGISSLLFHEAYGVDHTTPVIRDGRTIAVGDSAFESLPVTVYGYGESGLSQCAIYKKVTRSYLDDEGWKPDEAAWALCDDGILYLFNVLDRDCSTGVFAGKGLPADDVKEISIGGGISKVDDGAFGAMTKVKRAKVGPDVTALGIGAFAGSDLRSVYFTGGYSPGMDKRFVDGSGDGRLLFFHSAGDTTWNGIDVYDGEASLLCDLWAQSSRSSDAGLMDWIMAQWAAGKYPVLAYGDIEKVALSTGEMVGAFGLKYDYDNKTMKVVGYGSDGSSSVVVPSMVVCMTTDGPELCEVTSIASFGDSSSCYAIRSITVPSTVAEIGAGAFSGCTSLETILLLGPEPAVSGALGLPEGCVVVYTAAFGGEPSEMWGCKAKRAVPLDEDSVEATEDGYAMRYTLFEDRTAIVGKRHSAEVDGAANTSGFEGEAARIPDFVYDGTLLPYKVVGFDRYAFYKNPAVRTVEFGEYVGEGEVGGRPGVQDCTFREMARLAAFKVDASNPYYRSSDSADATQGTPGALYRTEEGLQFEVKITGEELEFEGLSFSDNGFNVKKVRSLESVAEIDYEFSGNSQFVEICVRLACPEDRSLDTEVTIRMSSSADGESHLVIPYEDLLGSDTVYNVASKGTLVLSNLAYPDVTVPVEGGLTLIKAPSDATEFVIDSDAVVIERYAFAGTSIASADIRGVQAIGSHAFYNCTGLSSVTSTSDQLYIEDSAFENCHRLGNGAELVSKALYIGDVAFYNANLSGDVRIPASVKYIGSTAFARNSGISSFSMGDPEGWTYEDAEGPSQHEQRYVVDDNYGILLGILGDGKYRLMQYPSASVTKDVFLDDLEIEIYSIDPYAFYGSPNVEKVHLQDGTVLVGREAFAECSSLVEFAFGTDYYGSDVYREDDDSGKYTYNMFGNDRALARITVPEGSYDFCADSNGVLYSKDLSVLYCYPAGIQRVSFALPEGTSKVYDCAFADNTSVRRVVVTSSGPVYIGSSAFANCLRLQEVYYLCDSLPSTGEKIYDSASPALVSYFGEGKGIVSASSWQSRAIEEYSTISELSQDSVEAEKYAFVVVGSDGCSIPGADVYIYYGGLGRSSVTDANGVAYLSLLFDAESVSGDGDAFYDRLYDVTVKVVKDGYYPYKQRATLNSDAKVSFVKLVMEPRIEGISCDDEDLNAGEAIVNLAEMSDDALVKRVVVKDGKEVTEWYYGAETVDVEFVSYTDSMAGGYTAYASTEASYPFKGEEGETWWEAAQSSIYPSNKKVTTTYAVSIPHDKLKPGQSIHLYLVSEDPGEEPRSIILNVLIIDAYIDKDSVIADLGEANIDLASGNTDGSVEMMLGFIQGLLPDGLNLGSSDNGVSVKVDGTKVIVTLSAGKSVSKPSSDCKAGYNSNTTGHHGDTYRFDLSVPAISKGGKTVSLSDFAKSGSEYTGAVKAVVDELKGMDFTSPDYDTLKSLAATLSDLADKGDALDSYSLDMYKFNIWFARGSSDDGYTYYRLSYSDGVGCEYKEVVYGAIPCGPSSRAALGAWVPMIVGNYVVSKSPLVMFPPTVDKKETSNSFSVKLEGSMVFLYENGRFHMDQCDVKGSIAYRFTASKQTYITTPVVVIPIYLSAEFNAGAEAKLTFLYDATGDIVYLDNATLEIALSLDLRAGIGVEWVSAGIYGKAAFNMNLSLYPFYMEKITLGGEVGFYYKFLFIEGELSILSNLKDPWVLYEYDENATTARLKTVTPLMTMGVAASDPSGTSTERKVEHQVDPAAEVVVYGGEEYLVHFVDVTEDGSRFVVLDADGDSRFDDYNYQKLRLDRLVGGVWKPVAAVDGQARSDVSFIIGEGPDGPVVVYTYKAGRATGEEANTYMLSGGMGVAYVSLKDVLGGIAPAEIDVRTDFYKGGLAYAFDGSTETIMWVENSDNSVLGTSPYNYTEHDDFKTEANSVWRAVVGQGVEQLVSGLGPVIDLAALPGGGYAFVVDEDCKLTTSDGRLIINGEDVGISGVTRVDAVGDDVYYYCQGERLGDVVSAAFDIEQESGTDILIPMGHGCEVEVLVTSVSLEGKDPAVALALVGKDGAISDTDESVEITTPSSWRDSAGDAVWFKVGIDMSFYDQAYEEGSVIRLALNDKGNTEVYLVPTWFQGLYSVSGSVHKALYLDADGLLVGGYSLASDGETAAVVFASPSDSTFPVLGDDGKVDYYLTPDRVSALFLDGDAFNGPVTIADTPDEYAECSVSHLRAQVYDGQLALHWDYGKYVDGRGEVVSSENRTIALAGSLAVNGCSMEYGDETVLVVTVMNTGSSPIDAWLSQYEGNDTQHDPVSTIEATVIAAGAEVELRMPITVSGVVALESRGSEEVTVSEKKYSDQEVIGGFEREYSDLRVSAEHIVLGSADYLLVTVFNDDGYAASGTLTCGPGVLSYDRDLYVSSSEFSFEAIEKGGHRTFTIMVDPGIVGGGITTVRVASDIAEKSVTDNVVSVSVSGADVDGLGGSSSANGIRKDPVLIEDSGRLVMGTEFTIKFYANGNDFVSIGFHANGNDSESRLLKMLDLGDDGSISWNLVPKDNELSSWKVTFSEDGASEITIPESWKADVGTYSIELTFKDRAVVVLPYTLYVTDSDGKIAWLDEDGVTVLYTSSDNDPKGIKPAVPYKAPEYSDGYRTEYDGYWEATVAPEGYVEAYVLRYSDCTVYEVVRIMSSETGKALIGWSEYYREGGAISYGKVDGKYPVAIYVGAKRLVGWELRSYEAEGKMLVSVSAPIESWSFDVDIGLSEYLSHTDGNYAFFAKYEVRAEVGDEFEDGGLRYVVVSDSEASVIGLSDENTAAITVPASISYGGVTFAVSGVGTEAFKGASLESVTVSSGMISSYAFDGCSSLREVVLEEGVVSIGYRAFQGCPVESISFPGSLESVGRFAFNGTTFYVGGAKADQTPAVLAGGEFRTIGGRLSLCGTGVGAQFEAGGLWYLVTSQSEARVSGLADAGVTAVEVPGSVSCGGSAFAVTGVHDGAFAKTGIESLAMPSGTVSNYAFSECGSLREVVLGDGVTSIGKRSFASCFALERVEVGVGLSKVGQSPFREISLFAEGGRVSQEDPAQLSGRVFVALPLAYGAEYEEGGLTYRVISAALVAEGVDRLPEMAVVGFDGSSESVVVPSAVDCGGVRARVVSIDTSAFEGSILKKAYISEGIRSVGHSAFKGCPLTAVYFPESLSEIRNYAFSGTRFYTPDNSIVDFEADWSPLKGHLFVQGKTLHKLNQSPLSVGAEFESGALAYRVASMAPMAVEVSGCVGDPESVEVPSYVEHGGLSFAVSKVGEYAFQGCSSLRSLSVEEGVRSIGYKAFDGCISLEHVSLPSSLEDVGRYAFSGLRFYSDGVKLVQDADSLRGKEFQGAGNCILVEVLP